MTLLTGYHDTTRTNRPPSRASVCLDNESSFDAFQSDLVLVRVYEHKSLPDPAQYAAAGVAFATAHRRPGQRVGLVGLNEVNNPFENTGLDPAGYRDWFQRWESEVARLDPTLECWWAGMSPGLDPLAWYAGCEVASGVVLHAYGLSVEELMWSVRLFRDAYPEVAWLLGETNHGVGAGRECDRDTWADTVLTPALDECQELGAAAVCYFVYDGWEQDDPNVGQGTPPIARGTRIETVLASWTPPINGGAPVSDIVLSVPERHSHAVEGNWGAGQSFGPPVGVTVHSTGGGSSTIENEYTATINWFQNPASGVSAQRVVGGGAFSEVNTTCHDREVAYHGRDPDNHRRHSIELAHGFGGAWDSVAYPDFQYEAAGELIARWCIADGNAWPIRLLSREELAGNPLAAGIALHKDTPAGVADGKRDPSPPFDPGRLVACAQAWHDHLTGGATLPPAPDLVALETQVWGLGDQLMRVGAQYDAAGYPHRAEYVRSQGNAVKEWVNTASKGQR